MATDNRKCSSSVLLLWSYHSRSKLLADVQKNPCHQLQIFGGKESATGTYSNRNCMCICLQSWEWYESIKKGLQPQFQMASSLLPWFSVTVPAISFCVIYHPSPTLQSTILNLNQNHSPIHPVSTVQCLWNPRDGNTQHFLTPGHPKFIQQLHSFLRQFLATALNVYWNII